MLVDAGLVLAVELVDKKSEVEEIGVEIGHRLGDPRTWTARVRVRKREIDANRGTAGAHSEINSLGERGRVPVSEHGNELLELELSAFVFERRPVDLQLLTPTGTPFNRTAPNPHHTPTTVRGAPGVRAPTATFS